MKVKKNLKHPYTCCQQLWEILVNIFSQKREFVTEHSFKKYQKMAINLQSLTSNNLTLKKKPQRNKSSLRRGIPHFGCVTIQVVFV